MGSISISAPKGSSIQLKRYMCVSGHICEGERALRRSRHPIKVCSPYVCLLTSIKAAHESSTVWANSVWKLAEYCLCSQIQRRRWCSTTSGCSFSRGQLSHHDGRAPASPTCYNFQALCSAIKPAAHSPLVTATTNNMIPLTHCLAQKKLENVWAKTNRFQTPGCCLLCFFSVVSQFSINFEQKSFQPGLQGAPCQKAAAISPPLTVYPSFRQWWAAQSFLQGDNPWTSLLHHVLVKQTHAHRPICSMCSLGQQALWWSEAQRLVYWVTMSADGKAHLWISRKTPFQFCIAIEQQPVLWHLQTVQCMEQRGNCNGAPNTPKAGYTQAMWAVTVPHNIMWSSAQGDRVPRTLSEVLINFLLLEKVLPKLWCVLVQCKGRQG